MFEIVIAAPALWSAVVVDWSTAALRSPCYSHMSIERCTIDISFDSYRQMYERVQAGGGRCAADEVTRKSADVHLP